MAICRRGLLLLCYAASSASALVCNSDWRSEQGDSYRSGRSCFTAPCNDGQPMLRRLYAGAQLQGVVDVDSITGLTVIQTSSLDIIVLNVSSGQVLWDTYNASTDFGAKIAQARRQQPRQEPSRLGMFPPSYIVSGAIDIARDVIYIQDTDSLTAYGLGSGVQGVGPGAGDGGHGNMRHGQTAEQQQQLVRPGEQLWRIGLDGEWVQSKLWQGVAGSGRTVLIPPSAWDRSRKPGPQQGARPDAGASNAVPQASDTLLLLLDVYSPIYGVVTADWLVAVDLNSPQVLWAQPVVNQGTTRSSCHWPPMFNTQAGHVYLTCGTQRLQYGTGNTTLLAVDLSDGSPVWNVSLDDAIGQAEEGAWAPAYFTPPVLVQPRAGAEGTAAQPAGLVVVGSAVPSAPGLISATIDVKGQLQSVAFFTAPAEGPGSGGPQGRMLLVTDSGQGSLDTHIGVHSRAAAHWTLVSFTADGAIAGIDAAALVPTGSFGTPPTAAHEAAPVPMLWSIDLGLPPVGPNANYGQYSLSSPSYEPQSSTAWWTWNTYSPNTNVSTSGLVGVQLTGGGQSGQLVYQDWPADVSGLGSGPIVWTGGVPLSFASPPMGTGTGTGTSSISLTLMLLGTPRIATAVTVALPAAGSRTRAAAAERLQPQAVSNVDSPQPHAQQSVEAVPSATLSFAWRLPTRGAVRQSPVLITNPSNSSQGLLIYSGWDDGILYAIDPASSTQADPVDAQVSRDTAHSRNNQDTGEAEPEARHHAVQQYAPMPVSSWDVDPETPDGSILPNGCVGTWTSDLLVCAGGYGSLSMLQLSTGRLLATAPLREHWADRCSTVPFPCYASGVVLLDDPASPSGLSLIFMASGIGPDSEGVAALIRLPDLKSVMDGQQASVDGPAVQYPVEHGAAPFWRVHTHDKRGGVNPRSPHLPVDLAWQASSGTSPVSPLAAYGRQFVVASITTDSTGVAPQYDDDDDQQQGLGSPSGIDDGPACPLLFLHRGYTDLQALYTCNGSLAWHSDDAYPLEGVWRVNSLVYGPQTDVVVVALIAARSVHPDEDTGIVAAVRGRDGSLLWRTPSLCIVTWDGLALQPAGASPGTGEDRVYVSCANAGPTGLPGKVMILSAVDGFIIGYAGQADGAMVSGPSLVNIAASGIARTGTASLGTAGSGASSPSASSMPGDGSVGSATGGVTETALVYGEAGGYLGVFDTSALNTPITAAVGRTAASGRAAAGASTRPASTASGAAAEDPAALPEISSVTLSDATTAVEWSALNVYPSFVFSSVSDATGVIYSAGGDDRNLYMTRLPGVACGSGPAPSSGPSLPSPSAGPSGSAAPVPNKDNGSRMGAGQVAGVVCGSLACVAVVLTAANRFTGYKLRLDRLIPSRTAARTYNYRAAAGPSLLGTHRPGLGTLGSAYERLRPNEGQKGFDHHETEA